MPSENFIPVVQFAAAWNPTACLVKFMEEGGTWSDGISVKAADVAAIAVIFQQKPVYFDPKTNVLVGSAAFEDGVDLS